ncbi:N-methyl-D-aspartate receptor NMDAR2C subunit [Leptolyngbya sp. FACHB-321]|uniref:HD domain-containing protein n=1 Tax=Leptolyngbya sp. FACHB-321 TaxID=2692807 RepID=UPI001682997A|nr:N-methyl-D-aspartate receptor NMDAR2C subunit [Leptolyngbya sp. FACHB-321]MBD2038159.1 N-methyl-D-aspartate receptor NMDAR2C subunit [Leptolyngbya sp. FACHB-321]
MIQQLDILPRWCQLWQEVGARSIPEPLFEQIVAAYCEPHRAYHTLAHLEDCFAKWEAVRSLAHQPNAIELALYFHDVIYDPRASDNEERSAALAVQWLQCGQVSQSLVEAVSQLILATKHDTTPKDEDAVLLVDIDLAILGSPIAEFDRYEDNIRYEYNWVPEALYRAKRADILEQFLDRSRLFQTDFFHHQYEQQARSNLRRLIETLNP